MRLFSWLLDCRASLAMTGRVQRRPLPVIARRACAAAIQSFSMKCTEETGVETQCLGHLLLFRVFEPKQSRLCFGAPGLPRFARNDGERSAQTSPRHCE